MSFAVFALVSIAVAAATMLATLVAMRRSWTIAVLVALVGAIVVVVVHGVYVDYYADDSYITLRYSQHLADGLGPNWNSTGRVEGYTSFLWMATLAGFGKLGFDLVDTSRVLGFFALAGTFVSVAMIWRLWRDDGHGSGVESPVLIAAVLLGLALTDGVGFWGFSGMETPLFMALLTAGVYCYLRERRGAAIPWSAVVFAAAAMTRPEGVIAAGVTGCFVLADALRERDRARAAVRVLSWGSAFVFLYGTYFAWRYAYYGFLFPNTFYAKVGLNADSLDRSLRFLADVGLEYHLLAMFVGVAILALTTRLGRDAVYLGLLSGALVVGFVIEGGDASHNRFLVPIMPLLLLGGLAGFAVALQRAALGRSRAALTALALSMGGLSLLPNAYDPLLDIGRRGIDNRTAFGSWLNEHTPEHYTIADFQVGAISYAAIDRDVLDLLGLNDVVIAHTDIESMGAGKHGHEKYNVDYVLEEVRPEIIVVGRTRNEPLSGDELRAAIQASPIIEASGTLLTDPRLWERYDARAFNVSGRWMHFLQRRDTVPQLQGPELH